MQGTVETRNFAGLATVIGDDQMAFRAQYASIGFPFMGEEDGLLSRDRGQQRPERISTLGTSRGFVVVVYFSDLDIKHKSDR
ncbi:hypothetical protein [Rubidibacter lacunae]|uniref:hypothetical protein n=1 Tax=Rubidibacter lacunae TaxID=582514 RepID=UPI0004205997|nr:hypothetical protein [Rubidibacter lacunae]